MLNIKKHLRLLALLGCLLSVTFLRAAHDDELMQIEAQMLKYMDSDDHETFYSITKNLKETSRRKNEERWFYYAWSCEGIYEATHQNYKNGLDIAKEILDYALNEGSIYGEFIAIHTEAMVQMQKMDYEQAEKAFLKAVEFRHRHFPNESAAEDLRELMKIAYIRDDIKMAKKYANLLLAEPNVAPHHKGRTLYRLSIMAFDENNVEEFNHIYEEMKRLTQTDGIISITLFTEVNHNIINGDYKQALMLADRLSPDTCAERKAIIYHRLGDDAKAYECMVQYKHISDSIERASHNSTVANIYLRMNNDRLRLEQELLAHQNNDLRYRYYLTIGIIIILILLFIIYKRHKIVRVLKHDNRMLKYGKKDAEKALMDINELSFYESKKELALTMPARINKLCDHLTSVTQNHSSRGVITIFQTSLPDDFEVKTNPDALEKLLNHLLIDSARFTNIGFIKLACEESEDFVRFTITDTSMEKSNKTKHNFSNFFAEEDNNFRFASLNFNICQSISRLLQGHIWRDTEYTDGIRFLLEIPKRI